MSAGLFIREVDGIEEIDALTDLHLQTLPGVTLPDFAKGWWWLAFNGHLPVGFAGLRQHEWLPKAAYLCAAGVLRSDRGHGLQKRFIRARERVARINKFEMAVTDTIPSNIASSNSLMACGYRLFRPADEWRVPVTLFWRKHLT